MNSKDTLYDLAFELKDAALWDRMFEQELFAVKFYDGSLGYCSIMGSEGTHYALGIYLGDSGLNSFRKISWAGKIKNVLQFHENLLCQHCLQCSFEDKDQLSPKELKEVRKYMKEHNISSKGLNPYPQFSLFEPSRVPWFVTEPSHLTYLREAMTAAIEIGKKLEERSIRDLGFIEDIGVGSIPLLEVRDNTVVWNSMELPAFKKPGFPSPVFEDMETAAKLRRLKKKGLTYLCEVVMLPQQTRDTELEKQYGYKGSEPMVAPYYPYMLLVFEQSSLYMLHPCMTKDYVSGNPQLIHDLADSLLESGEVPSRILVRDDRTKALLTDLSQKTGIDLRQQKSIPGLDEAEEDLFNYLMEGENPEAENQWQAPVNLGMDQFNDYFDSLNQTESDELTSEMLEELKKMIAEGNIPPELMAMLQDAQDIREP